MKQQLGIIIICLLCSTFSVAAQQELNLARQYLRKGEFAKAALLFDKLYTEDKAKSSVYYGSYLDALLGLEKFDKARQLVQQEKVKRPKDANLIVDMGKIYKRQGNDAAAKAEFEKAIGLIEAKNVRKLAYQFAKLDLHDYTIQIYEKGHEMAKDSVKYARELGEAYRKKGDMDKMIDYSLNYCAANPKYVQSIKHSFQRYIKAEEDMEELQKQLYTRIQKDPKGTTFPDLLAWVFIQQKDFESAIIQLKAVDKRKKESGKRMIELAKLARDEKQYDTAIEAYEYVLEKNKKGPYYIPAKKALLECRKIKVTKIGEYTKEDLTKLEDDYTFFLDEFGKKPNTVTTMRDLSHLYAYYIYDIGKAINLLQEVVNMPSAADNLKARSKLDLGDFYLLKGEVWESTLLYSQVDKAYRDDIIGEEARFKNAQLAYYIGDFEWSQAQLDVLKTATSELIANDALKLSVFITDNLGLDTTMVPMQTFARADLLIFQNKYAEAFQTLDSITRRFPKHGLTDDITLKKAEVHILKKEHDTAISLLKQVIAEYGEDILADDALFLLADLHEMHLDDKAKAMEYYEKLIFEHPDSLYVIEARKRFRKLRGDAVN